MTEQVCSKCATTLGPAPLYQPLSIESYDVRMLSFLPSTSTTIGVECTLQKHSLVYNPPSYVALSYCWGDEALRRDIIVNGSVVSVTRNLEQALWCILQRTGENTKIWADALCINQADKQERSLQVRLMTQIYQKAVMVYAWLGGPGSEHVSSGITSLRDMLADPAYPTVPPSALTLAAACTGLLSIFSCPLWGRRWIIQELTTASQVDFLCHTAHLSWSDLTRAYNECSASASWFEEHKSVACRYEQVGTWRQSFQWDRRPGLFQAILDTQSYMSKDPRDSIYALLGITSDGPILVPTPNYFESPGTLSEALTKAIISSRNSLDIILEATKSNSDTTALPTWSLDWCSSTLPSTIAKAPDTFITELIVFRSTQSTNGVLQVEGVTVGTITTMTSSIDCTVPPLMRATGISDEFTHGQSCTKYYATRREVVRVFRKLMFSQVLVVRRPTGPRREHSSPSGFMLVCIDLFLSRASRSALSGRYGRYVKWMQVNQTLLHGTLQIHKFYLHYRAAVDQRLYMFLVPPSLLAGNILLLIHACSDFDEGGMIAVITPCLLMACLLIVTSMFLKPLALLMFDLRGPFAEEQASSHRLCVLNNGAIGLTHCESRAGDIICQLAGCSQAVVLRMHEIDGLARYSLVGSARVILNKADFQKYGILKTYKYDGSAPTFHWVSTKWGPRSRKTYKFHRQQMELCSKQDWWQIYDLI